MKRYGKLQCNLCGAPIRWANNTHGPIAFDPEPTSSGSHVITGDPPHCTEMSETGQPRFTLHATTCTFRRAKPWNERGVL